MLFRRRIKVRVDLSRYRCNIYMILSCVKRELVNKKKEHRYNEIWTNVTKAKTIDEAHKILKKYVKLIDTSKIKNDRRN